jgi:hypothetical protein
VKVHGQVVLCPGVNDGAALDDTLAGVLDQYPALASLAVVPLGVSKFNPEAAMRPHTHSEANDVVDCVHDWQDVYLATLGRRMVFAADEYYLMADRPFPPAEHYEGFPMHEDGIGMARTFELEFAGSVAEATGVQPGFFAWVDGAPAAGYRASASTSSTEVPTKNGASTATPRRSRRSSCSRTTASRARPPRRWSCSAIVTRRRSASPRWAPPA